MLQALRDRVLDEDQPVPALLRLCLMLGQRSGSDELRVWARRELNGYGSDDVLPTYRSISEPPMFADSTNGVQIAHHQMLSRWDVPEQLREFIPEPLLLRQPINELEHMAATFGSGAPFTHAGLQALAALWNQRNRGSTLTMIERIYFVVGASQVSGVVDRVRTSLVDMIADLTADIGFDQLPDKRKVDTSVQIHMYGHGDQNSVIIQGDNHGVIGTGSGSQQIQNLSALPGDVTKRIERLRDDLHHIDDTDARATIENAIDNYEDSLNSNEPDPEQVRERGRLLTRLTESLGVTVVATGVFELIKAVSAAGLG